MYMNFFYIPWFTRLISYIYKLATSSHPELGLLRLRLWLGHPWSSNLLSTKITTHCNSRSSRISDSRASQVPDSRSSRVLDSRASQVSIILKWTADSREVARLGYHFCTLLENLKTLRSPSASLHEYSTFTKLEFSSRERFVNLSHEFRQTRRSRV
jgi:hypothetical protein